MKILFNIFCIVSFFLFPFFPASAAVLKVQVQTVSGEGISGASVFISSLHHREKIYGVPSGNEYYFENVPEGYDAVEADHPGFEPRGHQWFGEQPALVTIIMPVKNKGLYQPISNAIFVNGGTPQLMDSLGLELVTLDFLCTRVYMKKDRKNFDRYNCRELYRLRTHPSVRDAATLVKVTAYLRPHESDSTYGYKKVAYLPREVVLISLRYGVSYDQAIEEMKKLGFSSVAYQIFMVPPALGEGLIDVYEKITKPEPWGMEYEIVDDLVEL